MRVSTLSKAALSARTAKLAEGTNWARMMPFWVKTKRATCSSIQTPMGVWKKTSSAIPATSGGRTMGRSMMVSISECSGKR